MRSSGEATLSRRRRKPPSLPAVTSVVPVTVCVAIGGFPLAVLAVFKVFVGAKVVSVPWLLLSIVRWTEGRGLLLMGTGPLVVLPMVEVSERVAFLTGVATSEKLWTVAEDRAVDITLPTVDPASVEIVTAPGTSVRFIV